MDLFPLTREDKYKKRQSHARPLEQIKCAGHIDDIFFLHQQAKQIDLSEEAEMFLGYLEGMNNCVKSNTKSKLGIDLGYLCQNLCTGCHNIQYDNHICNNLFAPSERAQDKLRDIGQGFALLRAYKTKKESIVDVSDIIAAAPFVLFSKININPLWVQKHYQGNKWAAVKAVVNVAYQRFSKFLSAHGDIALRYFKNQPLSTKDAKTLEEYALAKDAWAYRMEAT